MGVIERIKSLFSDETKHKKESQMENQASEINNQNHATSSTYEDVPEYISVNKKDYPIVSVIASSIAAGEYSDSKFTVKEIKVKNPEFMKVAVIASSIASTYNQESTLRITKVQKVGEINA
ncbi:hypothetical protein AAK938_06190 [Aerococcaceae bacterium 50-4]